MARNVSALAVLLPLGLLWGCGQTPAKDTRRVIVLGVDGLDPDMLRERIDRGLMPSFAKLASDGLLTELQTSWPPQSPVAWTNFITGVNPGKHGLFDFIHVDRSRYGLLTSMSETSEPWLDRRLFGCVPLQLGATMSRTRSFPAFWDVMADAGVPVAVHRIPADFPVDGDSEAVVFPDMGTPDLTGAASGVASLWFERGELADARGWSSRDGSSYHMEAVEVSRYRVDATGRGVATGNGAFAGPPDGDAPASTPVSFFVDTKEDRPVLAVEVEGQVAIAPLGDWSGWIPVPFKLSCGIDSVSGYTRFLFVSAKPFAAYAAPVQIDPFDPVMAVSTPADASARLADAIGPYYTQGFPDAYKAYKVGMLTTEEFLSESDTVARERVEMLAFALGDLERRGGLLFFYTGMLDMRSHMLWHHADPEHPHREPAGTYATLPDEYLRASARFGLRPASGMTFAEQIDRAYMQADDLLGYLMREADRRLPGAELIVLSDHGFATMRRVMNVNDWLVREGYLKLRKPGATGSIAAPKGKDGSADFAAGIVDWDRSVAYAVGFNGIILNRKGREPRGVVNEARVEPLLAELKAKLLGLKDDDGTAVFTKVLAAREVFQGDRVALAPDLQLGFNLGYGASDPSAEGEVTGGSVLVPNDSRWSGSHLMDPDLVKGALLLQKRRKLARPDPRLEDVTATLYQLFSVTPPDGIDGRPLY